MSGFGLCRRFLESSLFQGLTELFVRNEAGVRTHRSVCNGALHSKSSAQFCGQGCGVYRYAFVPSEDKK